MIKNKNIKINNARENNLKGISVEIPKDKLTVITGVSGSGKSSLAFDVLYSEGRRRYIDSLSNYAKQFLGGTSKPLVDSIENLSPAIAIDQKTTSNNPRSTVGTITEIWDYYRVLYARIGVPYCPVHNIPISSQSITQIVNKIYKEIEDKSMITILAPVTLGKKGTHKDLLKQLQEDGFIRVRIDNTIQKLEEVSKLDKNKKHDIEIVVDRLSLTKDNRSRIFEALEVGASYSNGLLMIIDNKSKQEKLYSKNFACIHGDFDMPSIEPRLFSFNSPVGACDKCNGLGMLQAVTWESLVDETKSIMEGGIRYFGEKFNVGGYEFKRFQALLKHYKIDPNKKLSKFNKDEKDKVLYGSEGEINLSLEGNGWTINSNKVIEGFANMIYRRYLSTDSSKARDWYSKFLVTKTCDQCNGDRLNKKSLAVKIDGLNIMELSSMSIEKQFAFISKVKLTKIQKEIVELALEEIKSRFSFLINVGLNYLSLSRIAGTLSGGESQRIRLASQMGSKLTGVIYVLDEPSIGLHQRDNIRLIESLKEIRDLGNTVVVVEHDEDTMYEADYIIDIGPGAGQFGGEVTASGTPDQVMKSNSLTGKFLSGKLSIPLPEKRREGNGKFIEIKEAEENNLKKINVKIPLGTLTAITGVSGSGKSTLINQILYPVLHNKLTTGNKVPVGKHKEIIGTQNIDKVIKISQNPIGRTPRSNPATYTGLFDYIRDLFANTEEAKIRGYEKGRFSFNVKGGRCEKCQGDGTIKVSMQFLPDVYVECDECHGSRYNEETLQVKYKGKTIADILKMSVHEAFEFFENIPKLNKGFSYLNDVGLSYITLGHSATLLSGGEAQRVKLATYLQKRSTGKTLFILDEPTTGLHISDIQKLLNVLQRIVNNGDTVIVIEHNLDVIKTVDYLVDLGPDGGEKGGTIVSKGTPEDVAKSQKSDTGKFLKPLVFKKRTY